MAGFPPLNIGPPGGMSGGVPQYFTSRDPNSFFPGGPQYNLTMQRMLDQFGSLDPAEAELLRNYGQYGRTAQSNILRQGRMGATTASDAAAAKYDPTGGMTPGLQRGLGMGSDVPGDVEYAAQQLGTQAGKATTQAQAAQIPGQIAMAKQAIKNRFVLDKIKKLTDMIGLAASAAGGQYGYEAAQLGADQGQIALANAQDREAAQNLQSLIGLANTGMDMGNGLSSMIGNLLNPSMLASGGGLTMGGFLPTDSGQFLGNTAGMAGNAGAAGSAGFMDTFSM